LPGQPVTAGFCQSAADSKEYYECIYRCTEKCVLELEYYQSADEKSTIIFGRKMNSK